MSKVDLKGKVEVLQFPVSVTKFQALVGPWDHVAESAYHQFVAV